MVAQQPAAVAHLEMQRLGIADVVAVDQMYGQAVGERGLDRLRADQIAAMNDSLGPGFLCLGNCHDKWGRTVMTIGNDADFHEILCKLQTMSNPQIRLCKFLTLS